jgi:hypothetical protein
MTCERLALIWITAEPLTDIQEEGSGAGKPAVWGPYSLDGTRTLYREEHPALARRHDWCGRQRNSCGNNGLRGRREVGGRQT